MGKRLSNNQFLKKLHNRYGDKVTPLEKYRGGNVAIKFKCYKGHVFNRKPRYFFEKHSKYCPLCANKIRGRQLHFTEMKSNAQFLKDFRKVQGNRIIPLEKYKGRYSKIWFRCSKGHKFFTMPNALLNGADCPICSHKREGQHLRKGTNQFKRDVFDKVGNEYSVLGRYITNTTPILMKHNHCGRKFKVTPVEFLYNDVRCPNLNPTHKKTLDEFKSIVKNKVGNEFSVIGTKYINNRTPIKMRHNKCGHTFFATPDKFMHHFKCPYCSRTSKMTTKMYKFKVHQALGNKYTILGKYINAHTKIRVRHNKCGRTFMIRADSLFNGEGCPYCYGVSLRSPNKYIQEVHKMYGNEYSILSTYINAHTKIKIRHNKCGYVYWSIPELLLNGNGCPKCGKRRAIKEETQTTTAIKKRLRGLVGNEYKLIGKYKNSNTKITLLHIKCGHTFHMLPSNFLSNGCRCPYCHKASRGERAVIKYLKKQHIKYIYGYHLHNSKEANHELHLDFYLPKYNIGIEYDGSQHFHPVSIFGGLKQFKLNVWRDNRKNAYCKSKGIRLIRIEETKKCRTLRQIQKLVRKTLSTKLLPTIN